MTQDDTEIGRLICGLGVTPTQPAEFASFRTVLASRFRTNLVRG